MSSGNLRAWLERAHPASRYLVARDLVRPRPGDRELTRLRKKVVEWPPVQRVLARQEPSGRFAADKERSGAWPALYALRLLHKCGLGMDDEPVRRAVDWLLAQHFVKGAISLSGGGSGILPCYLGQYLFFLIDWTGSKATQVKRSLEWIADHQRFDHKSQRAGGDVEWPFRAPHNYGCWHSVSCYHGVVGTFLALASVPSKARSRRDREQLAAAIRYLAVHRAYKKSAADKPLFRHMTQFFLHGNYRFHLLDVLEGLSLADRRLARETWVKEALSDMEAHLVDRRVPLVRNYDTKMKGLDPLPLETTGEPSPLLTIQWLRTKKRFGLLDRLGWDG
jgi:hypothetical protein